MLLSVGIQPCNGRKISSNLLRTAKKPFQNPIFPTLKTPSFSFNPTRFGEGKLKPISISASAAATLTQETSVDTTNEGKKKVGVVVKPMERPRLVLKFIWMEKNLGIAIDQVIPGGHGTVPVSPYYFWPRKDAWEEIRVLLENKPWISQKQMVILLNQATDIINLWQQNGGDFA